MQIKKIQCPKCGVVLEVKNSKNEEIKYFNCPQCKTPLEVKFPHPMEARTFLANPPKTSSNDGETQLGDSASGKTQLVMPSKESKEKKKAKTAKLLFGGFSYLLDEGRNIVGRKGNTSKATVQIETADRYMSRQHCSITVTTFPDGDIKVVLSNYQNKNLTTVDGLPIETGDEIRLTDGNAITMGHTCVTIKIS